MQARYLEQSFVTNPVTDPFVLRDRSQVIPRDRLRAWLTCRIDWNDRLCKARDGDAFDCVAVPELRDHSPNRSRRRLPDSIGFEISPAGLRMRSWSRFRSLGDDVSGLIESETLDIRGAHIDSKNQVVVLHNGSLRV